MKTYFTDQPRDLAFLRPYASQVGVGTLLRDRSRLGTTSPLGATSPVGARGKTGSRIERHWSLHLAPLARALAACRPLLMPPGVPFHARKIGPQTFGWNGADAFAAHERMQAMLPAYAERAGCCNE